ncbi:MAG: putative metallophosphoesterase YhaO [Anaerolineales bacterium]|nr:putative metallophosphoesterase YhaO [Anaerolineales bacterium]
MSPDQLAGRRQRLRDAWTQTVDYAIRERADIYLHGGDLFDSPNPRTSELIWVARQFQRLRDAGALIAVIGGNHDVPKTRLGGATPQRIYNEVQVARCFTRTTEIEWLTHTVDGTRVAIGGLGPDPRLGPDDDPLAGVPIEPPDADVVLLMAHYGVEGTLHPAIEEPQLSKASVAALNGVDYLLAGHVHERRTMKIGDVAVCFPGPTERMTFGEIEAPTGFLALAFDGRRPNVKSEIRHRSIDVQPMKRIEIRTTNLPADDPTEYVFKRLRSASHPDQLLLCRIEGPVSRDLYHRLRFFDIWQLGNELNFYFDLDRRGVTVRALEMPDTGHASERVSPRQEIRRVAEGLAAGVDDEERGVIEEAQELILERWQA